MDILESLYYGLIIPAERQQRDNKPYSRTLERLKRSETRMLDMLDKEQREVFAQYDETMLNLSGIAEREAFACGFAHLDGGAVRPPQHPAARRQRRGRPAGVKPAGLDTPPFGGATVHFH